MRLNKTETAAFFQISLTALTNWVRRGAPVHEDGFDVVEIAEWHARREILMQDRGRVIPGHEVDSRATIRAEKARRRLAFIGRIKRINAMASDTDGDRLGPNSTLKVFGAALSILEQEMLDLPDRVLAAISKETETWIWNPFLLERELLNAVFEALDSLKGDNP